MTDIIAVYRDTNANAFTGTPGLPIPYRSTLTTSNSVTQTIATVPCADNTVMRVWGYVCGINTVYDGSLLTGLFDFIVERHGGASATMKDIAGNTTGCPVINIIKGGTTTSWAADTTPSGNNAIIRVLGLSPAVINWIAEYKTLPIT